MKYALSLFTQISSKKVTIGGLKKPLKSTTFIQKIYDFDDIGSSFLAQISSKRGIKRTPRKHLFVWMKYALHFLHKFHSKEELREPIKSTSFFG
jgi:hypothetical protein